VIHAKLIAVKEDKTALNNRKRNIIKIKAGIEHAELNFVYANIWALGKVAQFGSIPLMLVINPVVLGFAAYTLQVDYFGHGLEELELKAGFTGICTGALGFSALFGIHFGLKGYFKNSFSSNHQKKLDKIHAKRDEQLLGLDLVQKMPAKDITAEIFKTYGGNKILGDLISARIPLENLSIDLLIDYPLNESSLKILLPRLSSNFIEALMCRVSLSETIKFLALIENPSPTVINIAALKLTETVKNDDRFYILNKSTYESTKMVPGPYTETKEVDDLEEVFVGNSADIGMGTRANSPVHETKYKGKKKIEIPILVEEPTWINVYTRGAPKWEKINELFSNLGPNTQKRLLEDLQELL